MSIFKAVQVALAYTGGESRLEEVSRLGQPRVLRKQELDAVGRSGGDCGDYPGAA